VRIDLPGGGWAELKEPKDLKVKDKVAVQRVITWEQIPSDDDSGVQSIPFNAGLSDDVQMAMLGRIVLSWSPDGTTAGPVPLTPELLGDMDMDIYDAFCEATADHMQILRSRPNRRKRTGSSGS
jgi:hypothetical protein